MTVTLVMTANQRAFAPTNSPSLSWSEINHCIAFLLGWEIIETSSMPPSRSWLLLVRLRSWTTCLTEVRLASSPNQKADLDHPKTLPPPPPLARVSANLAGWSSQGGQVTSFKSPGVSSFKSPGVLALQKRWVLKSCCWSQASTVKLPSSCAAEEKNRFS